MFKVSNNEVRDSSLIRLHPTFLALFSTYKKPLPRNVYPKASSARLRKIRQFYKHKYETLAILRKKLRLGKIRFQASTLIIGPIKIYLGFKVVLPSTGAPNSSSLPTVEDTFRSLNFTFSIRWHLYLFRLILVVLGSYILYTFVIDVFLKIFFWDNLTFTPLLVKYPTILAHPLLGSYFSPHPIATRAAQPSSVVLGQRFPTEVLATLMVDI